MARSPSTPPTAYLVPEIEMMSGKVTIGVTCIAVIRESYLSYINYEEAGISRHLLAVCDN
jgi:hypothetical protein